MRNKKLELAVYGKGGIGKSTICANLSAALAQRGKRVLQIGCDPKHDSTRLLLNGTSIPTVLDYLKQVPKERADVREILREGYLGIGCVEAGGPRPGVGCAGRGIISAFEFLEKNHVKENYDLIVYDVLGDVVCGGFAVPVRREYADAIYLVTSGEFMSIYAANNILRGIQNYDGKDHRRVAGIIFNSRNVEGELERVQRFAKAVCLPICASIPRSDGFAQAEARNQTLISMEGFEEERNAFLKLAQQIGDGLILHEAMPLEDSELERVVLGKENRWSSFAVTNEQNTGSEPDSVAVHEQHMESETGRSDHSYDRNIFSNSFDNGLKKSDADGSEKEFHTEFTEIRRPPLYGCAFNGAATTAVRLSDAVVIAHSPRSCAFYTWQNISSSGRKNLFDRGILMPSAISPNFESTEIGQTEVIFGGMDKLEGQVKSALERKPKPGAVIVISSCVSGIIGDDIREMEHLSEGGTPVLVIPADGDIGGDYMEGIRMCLHKIGESLIDRNAELRPKSVNLIGEVGVSNDIDVNYRTIRRLLNRMGITVNCRFLGNATVSEMKHFLSAPLNILAHESTDNHNLKAWLQRQYGCAFADRTLPIGFTETKQFLEEVGDFFGCGEKVLPIIDEEEKKYRKQIEELRSRLAGKRILMTTISTNMDWLISAAEDAGMEFVWIGVLDYLRQGIRISEKEWIHSITEETYNLRRAERKISELKPDIVVSNYTSALSPGDYILDNMPMTQAIGFHSGVQVLKRWAAQQNSDQEGEWKHDRALFEKYFS